MIRRGIKCLTPACAVSVEWFILHGANQLDLCVLCRAFAGGQLFEAVERASRATRIVFSAIDLAYVREERRARLTEDSALLAAVGEVREREQHLIRNSDAAIVVSAAEAEMLAEAVPESFVVQLPLARAIRPPVVPWRDRKGIGFIGGFAHAPNVDAVRHFLSEIWPLVLHRMPDCTLTLVGEGLPPDVLDGYVSQVTWPGHVPDIGPWFESLRLTIAPLRFGAGAKGKIASSLAAGVPCVASSIAAEGMGLDRTTGVLVGETPAAFAEAIHAIYTEKSLWEDLSAGGLAYAGRVLSPTLWQDRLDAMLQQIGL